MLPFPRRLTGLSPGAGSGFNTSNHHTQQVICQLHARRRGAGSGYGAELKRLALTHSLHAGARVWANLSAPLSSVPSGSEGRGPGGLQGALTDSALKTESTGQEKRLEGVPPPSASANQRQRLAGCSISAPSPPPRLLGLPGPRAPYPACETWGAAVRCKPQTGGCVYKVGNYRLAQAQSWRSCIK